jgi:hypothetical protein
MCMINNAEQLIKNISNNPKAESELRRTASPVPQPQVYTVGRPTITSFPTIVNPREYHTPTVLDHTPMVPHPASPYPHGATPCPTVPQWLTQCRMVL